jgi:hypothetical protein
MQVSTSTFFRRQTDTMSDLKTESAQLQQKIATGKKLALPSDEPVAFSEVSVLKSRLQCDHPNAGACDPGLNRHE